MNQVQTLRSSVAGSRPTGRPPGELFTNWPDKQIGVVDAANQPMDLVAVRYFSIDANYPIGSFVVEAGQLWRSIVDVVPAPFDPAQWMSIGGAAGDFVTDTELATALADYLPLAGGTMTGPIVLSADAAAALNPVSLQQMQAANATYLPLAGGTMTGPLTGTSATFSGPVTSPFYVIDAAVGIQRGISANTSGSPRFTLVLADLTAETGANAGSNWILESDTDAGLALGRPLQIERARGVVSINGNGTIATYGGGTAASGDATLQLNKVSAAFGNSITGLTNATTRWIMQLGGATAESGANAGSDFALNAFADGGGYLSSPITCKRSTGVVTFSQPIVNGSDRRLKENIAPITGALDKVNALQGVSYTTLNNGKTHIGLIAQDTQPVLPEVVFETGQPLDAEGKAIEGEEPMLGISYGNLSAVLIEAIKELSAKVAALEGAGPTQTTVNVVNPRARPSR